MIPFYQWFLAELIEALRHLEVEEVNVGEAVASTSDTQTVRVEGREFTTPHQAHLMPRPGQEVTSTTVDGGEYLLGDGSRFTSRRFGQKGFAPAIGRPHSIPSPPLPLVSPACGVRIAEPGVPPLPSFPYQLAEDHYLDAGYARESFEAGTVLCGSPTDYGLVEVTGRYVQPDREPCDLESAPRLDHLAYRTRPSIRMPYMGGLDSNGVYLRVVIIPMKSCRQADPDTPV